MPLSIIFDFTINIVAIQMHGFSLRAEVLIFAATSSHKQFSPWRSFLSEIFFALHLWASGVYNDYLIPTDVYELWYDILC